MIWMAVIFIFSAMPADVSAEQSTSVTGVIIRFIGNATGADAAKQAAAAAFWEPVVRKLAHMTEYAVLALLIKKGKTSSVMTAVICFLYACTDEIHQLFVTGRAGRFTDVLIDTAGALILLILFAIVKKIHLHYNVRV